MSKYKVVPIEPTEEMRKAFHSSYGLYEAGYGEYPDSQWRSMLAAAPAVEQAPEVAKLVEAVEGLLTITDESLGVSGCHLNGNMAKWCEFEEVEMAEEALALYRQQGGDI